MGRRAQPIREGRREKAGQVAFRECRGDGKLDRRA